MAKGDALLRFNLAQHLVVEQGTRSIRDFVLANLNPRRRDGLPGTLKTQRDNFVKLRNKSTITADQFDALYPPTGDPINVDDIDLTLWVILLRNVTCVSDKAVNKKDSKVTTAQKTCRMDVMCIKEARNALAHKSQPELDEAEFDKLWRGVSEAIMNLCNAVSNNSREKQRQMKENLDRLKTEHLHLSERSIFQMQNLDDMRCTAVKLQKDIYEHWACGVLVAPFLVAGTIIPLVPLVIWNHFKARWKKVECVQCAAPNGGVINYVPRSGWGARPPKEELTPLETPVKYVILSHTTFLVFCKTTEECCKETLRVQAFDMDVSHLSDLAFNYMVGEHGVIIEGRGSDVWSACARGWNKQSLSFGFMGLYENILPSEEALKMLQNFLSYLVAQNKLQADYIIYCLCQLHSYAGSPGARLYREIQTWPHWRDRSGDAAKCSS